jgi:hypothetical protein
MWANGEIDGYSYEVKHYEVGSEHGIDGGCISKLVIRKVGEHRELASYDRGWDVFPTNEKVITAYKRLLEMFN